MLNVIQNLHERKVETSTAFLDLEHIDIGNGNSKCCGYDNELKRHLYLGVFYY